MCACVCVGQEGWLVMAEAFDLCVCVCVCVCDPCKNFFSAVMPFYDEDTKMLYVGVKVNRRQTSLPRHKMIACSHCNFIDMRASP